MREAGDVCYADVFRDGTGVVEFVRKEDMTYAVRKLDNTKFRSHEVCKDEKLHGNVNFNKTHTVLSIQGKKPKNIL